MDHKKALLRYTHKIYHRGWVANHDGNLTARIDQNRLLATPTALSKEDIRSDDLLVVDLQGRVVSGKRRVFSEINLHLAAYSRSDVGAVIHAHPPAATGMSVAGMTIERPIIAEAVVSIGDRVPLVPYELPGSEESAAVVRDHLQRANVLILQNHGVLSVGRDLEQAYLRLELVEHLAKITINATLLGHINPLPAQDVARLMEKHQKAGLAAPQAGSADSLRGAVLSDADPQLVDLVTREVMRVLGK